MKFVDFKFEDFAIINNILEREITRVKLCSIVDGFGDGEKITKKLQNVKDKIQIALDNAMEEEIWDDVPYWWVNKEW